MNLLSKRNLFQWLHSKKHYEVTFKYRFPIAEGMVSRILPLAQVGVQLTMMFLSTNTLL